MQYQEPAVGVSKSENGILTINCDCGDSSHAHTLMVNKDEFGIFVSIFTVSATAKLNYNSFFKNICSRIKKASAILFKGYSEYEVELVLTKQAALNYAKALESAVYEEEMNG